MVKTILIPTDFTVASLNTLKLALEQRKDELMEVILMYSEIQSDSITDLLFYSRDKLIAERITPEFVEALEIIKNHFEKNIHSIGMRVFHGSSKNAVTIFLEANRVNEIFIPKTYRLLTPKMSFDPTPLLRKAELPLYELDWKTNYNQSEQEQLISLFN